MNRIRHFTTITVFGCLVFLSVVRCATGAQAWPEFRGPQRDNRFAETGLLKQWPAEGPRLIWRAMGIGCGYASVTVVDGLIYSAGNIGDDTVTAPPA